ncbi:MULTISPECIES: ATP-binding protein [unclassified Sphingomonas]|uniref:ATP-binding protein n=1 Tax=unclassified Sphingomonas TaxID=196159 RepID=UPI0006FC495A|nr:MULTISPECIES: ATP-binding protein [unclassified Sphingomonas]KQX26382.1 anti-sigma regulatory factor [Sphingomonas sp. Root1294]KQY69453.1 anti-sigma regulatory factor [Sphingomonas sp. Root50]KRB89859.1 anti-sigma regulatory factor [Sphingomonas sp. Root720]
MPARFERTLPAGAPGLPGLIVEIEAWLGTAGVPPAAAARIMIAFDEVLSNIAHHGGGTLSVAIAADDRTLTATVADDGPPFDPLARDAPDTDLGIDDRAIGGLGIHLVREMMDDVGYAREKGWNRLIFSKTF